MVINTRNLRASRPNKEVVDVLRWHRCAREVEHDLDCGPEGTEGEQFDGTDERGRFCGWAEPLGSPRTESRSGSERDHTVDLPTAKGSGAKVVVVNPNRMRLIAESRKKTDRVDAET